MIWTGTERPPGRWSRALASRPVTRVSRGLPTRSFARQPLSFSNVRFTASIVVVRGSTISSGMGSSLKTYSGDGTELSTRRRASRARGIGVVLNPGLHPQRDVFDAVVEVGHLLDGDEAEARVVHRVFAGFELGKVFLAILANLCQDAAPAQVEADLQILAEVLRCADASTELVFLDGFGEFRFEVTDGEIGVPAGFAVRREVDDVAAR